MSNTQLKHYVSDTFGILAAMAQKAKSSRDAAIGTSNYEYLLGYLMAFHEVVSLLQQQANSFGIDLEEINLNSINPETELL